MTTIRSSRRVLVTGGAGFIGSHIVDAILARGDEPVVLDDLSSGTPANLPAGVRLIRLDIADPCTVDAIAATAPDLVIHAAAQVSVPASVADPRRDRDVNLVGTEHVIEGARRARARRLVFISSGGAVYGETPLADETHLPAPSSPYGIHKLAAEGYLATSGLSYGIVRYSNVYGPRQRAGLEGGVAAVFLDALREGQPITIHGTGEQLRDLLYVADAVSGALAVADAERDGVWNVSTGTATTVNGLLAALERLVGPARRLRREAARPGDVVRSRLANDLIRTDLGWSPRVSLHEGLAAMARWPSDATASMPTEGPSVRRHATRELTAVGPAGWPRSSKASSE